MKIEKVNDNQIRCTLTKADLADRQLKISELAYGTEKAKLLFRDMMQQAALKFGFEADDIPLMIEAIPLNGDCIVLIITKVEDPEELDTRFSKFAPSLRDGEDDADEAISSSQDSTDDVLDLFKKIQEHYRAFAESVTKESESTASKEKESKDAPALFRMFSFKSFGDMTRVCKKISAFYSGNSTLYKDAEQNLYMLIISQEGYSLEEFNKVCNMLSEYGTIEKYHPAFVARLEEHEDVLISQNAILALADMD